MNICCGENIDKENLVKRGEKDELIDYKILYDDKIYLTLEQTKLLFHEIPGVFDVDEIKPSESQKKNYDELYMKIEEKEDKINKSMNLYIPMIATFFFQKWKQNEKIDIDYIQKIKRKFIVKSLVMNRKLNKFKISLIKYVFKNK